MQYKVVKPFEDLLDGRHAYHEGDTFPREGMKASNERIRELSTDKNRRGMPLIQAVEDIPKEDTEEYKEEPLDIEAGVRPSKTAKAKKSGKKS